MKYKLNSLLEQKLSRKEFLQVIGTMLLTVIGVTRVLGAMNSSLDQSKTGKGPNEDYGQSDYGV